MHCATVDTKTKELCANSPVSIDANAVSTQKGATQKAFIFSCIAFIDRNHDKTAFGCVDVFRWAIFHLITDDIEASRTADMQREKEMEYQERGKDLLIN
jgi:hypothetical protein